MPKYNDSLLPQNDVEAEKRYELYKCVDPFPKIECAMLNSEDIFKYVAATGMIYPFRSNKLSATKYDVGLEGLVVYWNDDNKKIKYFIGNASNEFESRDKIILKPNSITYITLEPTFRMPDYLIFRFNLKISHVYKGLLLGTGPIVDPGFCGKLSLPLHNLTANEYVFSHLDDIISLEITKLSTNELWDKHIELKKIKGIKMEAFYKENHFGTSDVEEYIKKALKPYTYDSVRSSIPDEIKKSAKIAKESEKKINTIQSQFKQRFDVTIVVSVLTFVATVLPIIISHFNMLSDLKSELSEQKVINEENNKKISELEQIIKELQDQLSDE